MDPVTMMVASIGMQFFTQHASSKKNAEIQEKQREFQKAAADHDFERMRRLQAESAKLALELEAEVHQERIKDINDNYDTLLENFAHSFAIQNWPLNVLPFVMKGESFGSLFNGTSQSVNMHCIFTPSNCDWFNEMFFDDIDLQVEAEMNNNWNAQTTHPIVYYGGGWNRRELRHGISIPKVINLVDIDLLKVKLKNVPVVVITPYFDPWLHFRVQLWGMGKDSNAPFRIDIPHGDELDFSDRIFSYDYNKERTDGMTNDFINTTIEEFVSYLTCLIGFTADSYFLKVYNRPPQLMSICQSKDLDNRFYIKEYKNKYLEIIESPKQSLNDFLNAALVLENMTSESEQAYRIVEKLHNSFLIFTGGVEGINHINKKVLYRLRDINSNQSFQKHLSEEIKFIEGLEKSNSLDMGWVIVEKNIFHESDFLNWVEENRSYSIANGSTHAVISIRENYYALFFLNANGGIVYDDLLNGVCVISESNDMPESLEGKRYIYIDLLLNKYTTDFMEKKHFDSFERLGKQLDVLVNNFNRIPSSISASKTKNSKGPSASNNFESQLAEFFTTANCVSMEAEKTQIAKLDDIKEWINSKIPVKEAEHAHIFNTIVNEHRMICVFFSDKDLNTLIGDEYPMKRIVCDRIDSDLEAFFNGLSIGTIKL